MSMDRRTRSSSGAVSPTIKTMVKDIRVELENCLVNIKNPKEVEEVIQTIRKKQPRTKSPVKKNKQQEADDEAPMEEEEVPLSTTETWLLSPHSFFDVLGTEAKGRDVAKMAHHICQCAIMEFGKTPFGSTSISSNSPIPANFMAWAGKFADDDPKASALPALYAFMAQLYKAKLYVDHFPIIQLLGDRRSVFSQYSQSIKDDDSLHMSILRQRVHYQQEAKKASEVAKVMSQKRLENMQRCVEATNKCMEIVQYQAKVAENRQEAKRMRLASNTDSEENAKAARKEEIKRLEEQNTLGRRILGELIAELIKRRQVSKNLQPFLFNIVNTDETELDFSKLEPRDLEFLVDDTQIVRSKSVNGQITFQLNDLCD